MEGQKINERYSRHLSLQGFGQSRQDKLRQASVLVIGAGGLGCPVLQYLCASGVGKIGIVDDDLVSLSNLQRQILYTVEDIGYSKAIRAAEKLSLLNPEISILTYNLKVNNLNALDLFHDYDVIVDGTDNFASRYLINDACVLLNKPLVFAAIYQYEGQVAIFNVEDTAGLKTNYRDLFSTPPAAEDAPDCNEAGVLGVLPGIIGLMQATEVIKLITGLGQPLYNKLLVYNLLQADSFIVQLTPDAASKALIPMDRLAFERLDYEWFCGTKLPEIALVDANEFYELSEDQSFVLVDVREPGELPAAEFPHLSLPLSQLTSIGDLIAPELSMLEKDNILLFCQSGMRSMKAAAILSSYFGRTKDIYSLKGGILNL
jgi:molybdopterin/thiamine biosynthesis adenylyltransferase/rhodanese-related sulfurtransferase